MLSVEQVDLDYKVTYQNDILCVRREKRECESVGGTTFSLSCLESSAFTF